MTKRLVLILATLVAAAAGQFIWVSLASADGGIADLNAAESTKEVLTEAALPPEQVAETTSSPTAVESLGETPESVVQTGGQPPNHISDTGEPVVKYAKGDVEATLHTASPVVEPLKPEAETTHPTLGSVTEPALSAVEAAIPNAAVDGPIPGTGSVQSIADGVNAAGTAIGSASDRVPTVEPLTRTDLSHAADLSSQVISSAEAILVASADESVSQTNVGRIEFARDVSQGGQEPPVLGRDNAQYAPEAGARVPALVWTLEYSIPGRAKSPLPLGSPSSLALEPSSQASTSNGSRIDWPDPVWAGLMAGLLAAGIFLALPTFEARPRTLNLRPSTPPA